jgi:hypothetical protein
MPEILFRGEDLADLLHQLQRFLNEARLGLVPVPPPGYGLNPVPGAIAGMNRGFEPLGSMPPFGLPPYNSPSDIWEQGRKHGFSQGYERGLLTHPDMADVASQDINPFSQAADKIGEATAALEAALAVDDLGPDRSAAYILGQADQHQARADELRKAAAYRAQQERNRPQPVPGTAAEEWTEQDRQEALAAIDQRARAYGSSPEVVAETLRQQHHSLPGE